MLLRCLVHLLAIVMLLWSPTGCMSLPSLPKKDPPPPTQKDDQDGDKENKTSQNQSGGDSGGEFKKETETLGAGKKLFQGVKDAAASAGKLVPGAITGAADAAGKTLKCVGDGLSVADAYNKEGFSGAAKEGMVLATKHAISSAATPVITSVVTTVLTEVLAPVVLAGTISMGTGLVLVGIGTAVVGFGARYAVGKFVDNVVVPAAKAGADALGDAASHGFMDDIPNVDGMANGTPDINNLRPRVTVPTVIPTCISHGGH